MSSPIRSPVSRRIRDYDISVLVYPYHCPCLSEALVHPVRPPSVAVLKVLHDLEVEVNAHLVADLLFPEKNKNRLCSKTCGIDKRVKNPEVKTYSEIQFDFL